MKVHPNELFLYYDSNSPVGKQTLALAKTCCNHIRDEDWNSNTLSRTQWEEIIELLKVKPEDVMDHGSELFIEKIDGHQIGEDDLLELLVHNTELLRYPIAIHGNRGVLVKTPTDVLKLR